MSGNSIKNTVGAISVLWGLLLCLSFTVQVLRGSYDGFLVILAVIGLLFVVAGLLTSPVFCSVLKRRHEIWTVGNVKTVEYDTIDESSDTRCVVCDSPVSNGMIRRFRYEFVVAGFPTTTINEGTNCYCRTCALEESSIETNNVPKSATTSCNDREPQLE